MGLSKDERLRGYRMTPQPSDHTTAILRRVGRGFINITLSEDKTVYRYEDGDAVRDARGYPLTTRAFRHMVTEGWLLPLEGGSFLANGPPQQYRARTPVDGKLPRIIRR